MKSSRSGAGARNSNDEALCNYLQEEGRRELVVFVLSALLHSDYQAPIYLFAPPETLDGCERVIHATVPKARSRGLTVAIRDGSVLRSDARVAGYWSNARDADLPAECYVAPNAAFHTVTGRRSDHVIASPYAEFAVAQLSEGRSLSAFLHLCDECHVKTATDLEDLFALEYAPARLEFPRIDRLIDNPATLERLRQSPAARKRCEEWAHAHLDVAATNIATLMQRVELFMPPNTDVRAALDRLAAALKRH